MINNYPWAAKETKIGALELKVNRYAAENTWRDNVANEQIIWNVTLKQNNKVHLNSVLMFFMHMYFSHCVFLF